MKEEIILSDNFEAFEKMLWGFSYHQDAGLKNLKDWKDRNLKLAKSIKLALEQNLILIDKGHKELIIERINLLIEKISQSKNIDTVSNEVIIELSKIVFLLLGEFPNNWDRKSKALPIKWRLNRHRTLKYIISEKKRTLIIFRHLEKTWGDKEKVQILRENLTLKMDSNYKEFNKWFKEKYTNVYNELFYP